MVSLPKKKVGLISCGGEELPEGTISRVATLAVLERLRPDDTVTLCLPLFLAGEESERAFARFYPTIAVDGCEKLCAKRATEKYSAPVAGSVVVSDLLARDGGATPSARRDLPPQAMRQADLVAREIARMVDTILERRPANQGIIHLDSPIKVAAADAGEGAVCSCRTGGIPVTQIQVGDSLVGLMALEPLFQQALENGLAPDETAGKELLKSVRVYNYVPPGADALYEEALTREYSQFCRKERVRS